MTQLINALSARTRFGELMEQAEKKNSRFLVSRRGKPTVVILSVSDYMRSIVKAPEFLTKIQLSAQKAGLDKMTNEEIDQIIQDARNDKNLLKRK